MPGATQGITQRLQDFTSQLKEPEKNEVLRLRKGRIYKGKYKGTRWGRFKHWSTKGFKTREQQEARERYLDEVTERESRALAAELCTDISKRTPVPYRVERQITGQDVETILERTRTDREQFTQTVKEVAATASTETPLKTDIIHSAGERVHQSLMDCSIRRPEQLKQLEREVVETLSQRREAHRASEPLPKALQGKNFKKLKQRLTKVMEEKLLTLALFRQAEEYATKEMLPGLEDIPKTSPVGPVPVPLARQRELVKSFVDSNPIADSAHKSIALLSAEHMLAHGFNVEDQDIPDLSQEGVQSQVDAEIKRLRDQDSYWSHEVADLMEQQKFREAHVVTELARDSESLELLEDLREQEADRGWDKFLGNQRDKIKKGKKPKVQSHNTKRLKHRGPSLKKAHPQNVFDRVRPWRGGLSRLATAFAKQTISTPVERDGDGSVQSRQQMIEQTLNMMRSKYKSFSEEHNAVMMTQLQEYLEKNLRDRQVTEVDAALYINPLSQTLTSQPVLIVEEPDEFSEKPEFDVEKMESVEKDDS